MALTKNLWRLEIDWHHRDIVSLDYEMVCRVIAGKVTESFPSSEVGEIQIFGGVDVLIYVTGNAKRAIMTLPWVRRAHPSPENFDSFVVLLQDGLSFGEGVRRIRLLAADFFLEEDIPLINPLENRDDGMVILANHDAVRIMDKCLSNTVKHIFLANDDELEKINNNSITVKGASH